VAAAAAAAAVLFIAPALRGSGPAGPLRPGGGAQVAQTETAWQAPDPDTLWTESAVLDLSDASGSSGTYDDAALAAYDAGAGDD
jgi:hypothetical protein